MWKGYFTKFIVAADQDFSNKSSVQQNLMFLTSEVKQNLSRIPLNQGVLFGIYRHSWKKAAKEMWMLLFFSTWHQLLKLIIL